jgi:hypothetical protein
MVPIPAPLGVYRLGESFWGRMRADRRSAYNISMTASCILEWLNAIGPIATIAVALAVFFVTWSFYRWQVRIAQQKLRHRLYDRRFAIYAAFRELLQALVEKNNDEIMAAFRNAESARFQAPFLLDDPKIQANKIQASLDALCKEVDDDVISYIRYLDAVKSQDTINDPQMRTESTRRADRFGRAKLIIADRYFVELPKQFKDFLRLTDFWK